MKATHIPIQESIKDVTYRTDNYLFDQFIIIFVIAVFSADFRYLL